MVKAEREAVAAGRPARAAPERPAFWLGAASNAERSAVRRGKASSQAVKGMAGGAGQLRAAREAPTLHVDSGHVDSLYVRSVDYFICNILLSSKPVA